MFLLGYVEDNVTVDVGPWHDLATRVLKREIISESPLERLLFDFFLLRLYESEEEDEEEDGEDEEEGDLCLLCFLLSLDLPLDCLLGDH